MPATGRLAEAEVDLHRIGRSGVVDDVGTDTKEQPVIAGTVEHAVTAGAAEHSVVADAVADDVRLLAAVDRVVPAEGEDHVGIVRSCQDVIALGADDRCNVAAAHGDCRRRRRRRRRQQRCDDGAREGGGDTSEQPCPSA